MKLLVLALTCGLAGAIPLNRQHDSNVAKNPTVKLNNGVEMPLVAIGTWQYDNETAADAIHKAFKVGYTHVDTAWNYFNQQGVGKALSQYDRESFFLTTKTPPCKAGVTPDACYNTTKEQLAYDLNALKLDHVDLVLIHGSSGNHDAVCDASACELDYAQWRAYEAFFRAGKAKAIGLSNYCVSCLDCLLKKATVAPTVNQVQFHVGMGSDPNAQALLKMNKDNKIVTQAYSPLGDGKLISDSDLQTIGKKYGKSSAQVALKWIVTQGLPLATKSDTVAYLQQDFDLFSWNLTAADMASLSTKASPVDRPSWSCTA